MSLVIDVVSIVSQTWIFKKCCDISFRTYKYRRLQQLMIFILVCAAHLVTEMLDFDLSLLISMVIDYLYITLCYRSDWKRKHVIFLFLYLADFGLETLAITGLMRINPVLTPADIINGDIALIITIGIRLTELVGVFILKTIIEGKHTANSNGIRVTATSILSILVLWFVFPWFWQVQDEKVNSALMILVLLVITNNTLFISNYITINASQLRELKLSTMIHVERDKTRRLLAAVRSNHSLLSNLAYIRAAITSGDCDKAVAYIDKLSDSSHLYDKSKSITKNMDIDFILQRYVDIAQEKSIRLDLNCRLPIELPFEVDDIIILISNIMDNAVSAVCKLDTGRFINLSITYLHDRLCIVEKNPFAGKISTINNSLYSEKHGGPGFGIDIINYIVNLYDGGCDTHTEKQTFTISIILQKPNESKGVVPCGIEY